MSDVRRILAQPDFQPGFQPDLSFLDYLAHPAIGSSDIRTAMDSLKAFYWRVFGNVEQKDTQSLRLGRLIHHAVLEPSSFKSKYVVEPIFEGYTQKGELTTSPNCTEVKRKKAAWYSDLPHGSVVVTPDQRDMLFGIVTSIFEHPQGADLFKNGRPELTGFFKDEETGLALKLRTDFLSNDCTSLVDLKSCRSSAKHKFGSDSFSERYDLQVYTYAQGIKAITGKLPDVITLVAVEKEPPYECAVYYFEPSDFLQAESDYRKVLKRIRNAVDENRWPQRQNSLERIHTPTWFQYQSLDEEGAL